MRCPACGSPTMRLRCTQTRCHSLRSLLPPQAALPSLPTRKVLGDSLHTFSSVRKYDFPAILIKTGSTEPVFCIFRGADARMLTEHFGKMIDAAVPYALRHLSDRCIEVTVISAAMKQALECSAREGRISLLGCTQISDCSVDYYAQVHRPGVDLIGSHLCRRGYKLNNMHNIQALRTKKPECFLYYKAICIIWKWCWEVLYNNCTNNEYLCKKG